VPRKGRKEVRGKQAENIELAAREREIQEMIKRLRAEQKRIRRARRAINNDTNE
jgi:hypothetical protein